MQYFTNESFMALLCLSNTLAGAFLHLKKNRNAVLSNKNEIKYFVF